jgi:hypothetical protein
VSQTNTAQTAPPVPPAPTTIGEWRADYMLQHAQQLLPMTNRQIAQQLRVSDASAAVVRKIMANILAANGEGTMLEPSSRSGYTTNITDTKEDYAVSTIGAVTAMNSWMTRLAENMVACPNGDATWDQVFGDMVIAIDRVANHLATL